MKHLHLHALILCFSFLSSNLAATVPSLTASENQTLHAIFNLLSFPIPTSNPCQWHPSITCTPTLSLSLPSISANLSSFPRLFTLLCQLPSLRSLDLSLNSLSSFPSCLNLSSLTHLNLSSNSLNGTINNSFTHLSKLQTLVLSFNKLTGTIPLLPTSLNTLVLSNNQLNGTFPHILRYPNLTVLDLSNNMLSGSVPDSVAGMKSLQRLVISSNKLTGRIPEGISEIRSLRRFAANLNMFTGSIPEGIGRYLKKLDLSYNQLSGEIPDDLLTGVKLQSVDLTSNQLVGRIPVNLTSTSLYRLRLGQNLLNGSIPPEIGKLSNLTYLELDENRLESEIPVELAKCKNLTLLNLGFNGLRGPVPGKLGELSKLVVVKMQKNYLSGKIPDGFFELSELSMLDLSSNLFTGMIPEAIYSTKLSTLNLEGNKLEGSIPAGVGQWGSLIELRLGSNQLSGEIPLMPRTLSTSLNLSSNQLSGSIPSSLGFLQELIVLDLSENNLTGYVPYSLTRMGSLTQLLLSNNELSGELPRFNDHVIVNSTGNEGLGQATEVTKSRKTNHLKWVMIIGILSAVVIFCSAAAIFVLFVWKRIYRVGDITLQSEENPLRIVNGCLLTSRSVHKSGIDFTKALEETANPANVMLKTKFSTYYNAEMLNGVRYTVKKINCRDKIFPADTRGRLKRDLEDLGSLSSSNIMTPLAYVLAEESAYLFYEQVHKGTVYDFLHNSENVLDWSSRYSITLGVAHGLAFLHGGAQPVLLFDLTSKSIHLKSPKEPQIGDIELCKVIDPTKSIGSLSTVAGSVGYIPPEYAYTMRLTMAGNVYSFGVVLLELLTGKPPVNEGIELAKWALGYSSRLDERVQILDPRISRTSVSVRKQMLSVLKIALACVSLSPEARPKTRNVLRMLFNAR